MEGKIVRTVRFYREGRYMGWRKLTRVAISEVYSWCNNSAINTAIVGETVYHCYNFRNIKADNPDLIGQ